MGKLYEMFKNPEDLMRYDKEVLVHILLDQNERLEKARQEWKRLNDLLKTKT